jgi:hypothetical protein
MRSSGLDNRHPSDLDIATLSVAVPASIVAAYWRLDMCQGCGHENLLGIKGDGLICNANQGRGDAGPPRLELRERAIAAARAPTGHGARVATGSSRR